MKRSVLVIGGLLLASTCYAGDPEQTLHDTYCIMCHDTQVYTRETRVANDYESVRVEVNRWQTNLSLNWSQEQIDRMTTWLAKRYYKIHCPHGC